MGIYQHLLRIQCQSSKFEVGPILNIHLHKEDILHYCSFKHQIRFNINFPSLVDVAFSICP